MWQRVLNSTDFPNLASEGFEKTSDPDDFYNCIAWAAGEDNRFWWPDAEGMGYWPPGAPRNVTIDAFIEAFKLYEYEICVDDALEGGFEKIALYALNDVPTHAARQEDDGSWTSKIGRSVDITHTLAGVEGPFYGHVTQIMRRPIT